MTTDRGETIAPDAGRGIDLDLIAKISASWPKRAGVRQEGAAVYASYDTRLPDYPSEMVPFWSHPLFSREPEEKHRYVLTLAWLGYNQRTITAEEVIANPALSLIREGYFPGADAAGVQNAVQQILIDEHFHILMHMTAIQATCKQHGLFGDVRVPHAVTYHRLKYAQAQADEDWQVKLLTLAFAVVAEVSVNSYLDLLAKNEDIQPMHRQVAALHNQDEFSHSMVIVEVAKSIYVHLSSPHRAYFVRALPVALRAFFEQDYSAWSRILRRVGISRGEDILRDCQQGGLKSTSLTRDYSGLEKLALELDIMDQLDFDFSAAKRRRAAGEGQN